MSLIVRLIGEERLAAIYSKQLRDRAAQGFISDKDVIAILGEKKLSEIYRVHATRQVKDNMKAEFQDNEGRWYYSFRDDQDVPIARTSEAHVHMQYMAAGLSAETWNKAMETLEELIAEAKYIKMGVVLNDLTDLSKKIINFDAVVNIIAVHYVREDEDVAAFTPSIHQEKCDFLKTETEEGRFFFQLPMFAKLLSPSILSSKDAQTFWLDYIRKSKTLLKRWSTLISKTSTDTSAQTEQAGSSS